MIRFLFFIVLLGVAACQTSGKPPPPTANKWEATQAVCETTGINTNYNDLTSKTSEWRSAISSGASLDSDAAVDIVALTNRLDAYNSKVDAMYRNVTNSCKVLTACLEARNYNVNECSLLYDGWRDAEEQFTDLFTELAGIEAEVEKTRVRAGGGAASPVRVNRCDVGSRNCSAGAYDY